MPFVGHGLLDAYIVAFLCNAMQFKVQCRIADPEGMRRSAQVANPGVPEAGIGSGISFGLAGGLAHYSASDRICAFTYSARGA